MQTYKNELEYLNLQTLRRICCYIFPKSSWNVKKKKNFLRSQPMLEVEQIEKQLEEDTFFCYPLSFSSNSCRNLSFYFILFYFYSQDKCSSSVECPK